MAHALITTAAVVVCPALLGTSTEAWAGPVRAGHAAETRATVRVVDDGDRDGLPDALEGELLRRFAPVFMVSAGECDGLPAEFLSGSREPRVVARNGTIYGQVSKAPRPGWPGALVEIHYYHLWSRDCGRIAHTLDVEHVSVLVQAEHGRAPVSGWKALYWYAAAHEDTVCDASHGARAVALDAIDRGPTVWISRGKHASFFTEGRCAWGCGGDRCNRMVRVPSEGVINLGEPDAPLNGAVWIGSTAWPLAVKMQSDFSNLVLTRLHQAKEGQIVALNGLQQPWQAMILGGDSTADAVATTNRRTGKAVGVAGTLTGGALAKSAKNVGKALGRAASSVWKAFGQ